jgi:hypothetical protein
MSVQIPTLLVQSAVRRLLRHLSAMHATSPRPMASIAALATVSENQPALAVFRNTGRLTRTRSTVSATPTQTRLFGSGTLVPCRCESSSHAGNRRCLHTDRCSGRATHQDSWLRFPRYAARHRRIPRAHELQARIDRPAAGVCAPRPRLSRASKRRDKATPLIGHGMSALGREKLTRYHENLTCSA